MSNLISLPREILGVAVVKKILFRLRYEYSYDIGNKEIGSLLRELFNSSFLGFIKHNFVNIPQLNVMRVIAKICQFKAIGRKRKKPAKIGLAIFQHRIDFVRQKAI
ncbi:hypothetical protein [Dyadobacter luticola]|uniref:hypothetical protein n=1 Tax=Dyadobacter luticola TaxID=1979387 RepID=UPI0014871BB3|nr:hypothetical protein [Dyadobacter luticola]